MKSVFVFSAAIFLMTSVVFGFGGDMGNGRGTLSAPYLIEDLADFDAFANSSFYRSPGVYTKLMTDINLSARTYTTAVILPWSEYDGIFNGNGYAIKNLTIDTNDETENRLGLFSSVGSNATIKNLGIENAVIIGGANSCFVGGLCGKNMSNNIISCYANVAIKKVNRYVGGLCGDNTGDLRDCYATGVINGTGNYIGGLCGYNFGHLKDCYATGVINGTGDYIGGLCGKSSANLTNCFSTSTVSGENYVGGLTGELYSMTITNCYSTGNVNGNNGIGGLVGYNNYSNITNSYSIGVVDGSGGEIGGLVGKHDSGCVVRSFWDVNTSGIGNADDINFGAIGKTTAQMQSRDVFNEIGWDFIDETVNGTSQVWQMSTSTGYPALSSFNGFVPVVLRGNGSSDNPYLISTALELGAVYHYRTNAFYRLTANIDLSNIQWSSSIVPVFDGSFNGSGFCIKNFSTNGGGHLGLFGYIGQNCIITNLGLEDVTVAGTGKYIGGLVGEICFGSVSNSYVTGSVVGNSRVGGLAGYIRSDKELINCYSKCSVSGEDRYVGGLIGRNYYGSVKNCHSNCSVVSSSYMVGGLIGHSSDADVINCYSTGTVSGSGAGGLIGQIDGGSLTDSHATSSVNGDSIVGGLVGYISSGTILRNCYSNGSVEGSISVGGLVGSNMGKGLTDCYSTCLVSGDEELVGGLVGRNYIGADLVNCYSTGNVQGSGNFIGGLIGYNYADATNCYATGVVSGDGSYVGGLMGNLTGNVTNCYSSGSVSGSTYVGGLIGHSERDNTVKKCFSIAPVNGYTNVGGLIGRTYDSTVASCYSISEVSGDSYAGGLIGMNYLTDAENCYSTGSVTGDNRIGGLVGFNDGHGVMRYCYATGRVSGNSYVGGLVGRLWSGAAVYSFWDMDTSGLATTSGLGYGRTSAEMQLQSTFTSVTWDFSDGDGDPAEWRIDDGYDYPKLAWQPCGDLNNDSHVNFGDFAILARQWQLRRLSWDISPSNEDGIVNLLDFTAFAKDWTGSANDLTDLTLLAEQWLKASASNGDIAPNLTRDGVVDILDLQALAENWLKGPQF